MGGSAENQSFGTGQSPAIGVRSPGDTSMPVSSASSSIPTLEGAARPSRATFDAGELAKVCSRYDVGEIESVKEYRRGSSRSPKVTLRTSRGAYLLKRRAAEGSGATAVPERVRYSHAVQQHLAARRFPLPALVPLKGSGETALVLDGHVYELFEFVPGNPYDASLDATGDAGRLLAYFHKVLGSFRPEPGLRPRTGACFHNAAGLGSHLDIVQRRLGDRGQRVVESLRDRYADAAVRAEALGASGWPSQIIHGDWHPGNMVFRGSRTVAIIDYDTVRRAPRAIDLANGALQFSIIRRGEDPSQWPAGMDEGRLKRFCRGYDLVPGCIISTAELEALPWLMIEAIIVEAAVPIAATGGFGGLDAGGVLRMVDAKAAWIAHHAQRLTDLVGE
ncbi:MAG: phosphotransferase [Phycisphaerales bacterium]|nr:phosphotransferase [Phycisphaerales bacterium]